MPAGCLWVDPSLQCILHSVEATHVNAFEASRCHALCIHSIHLLGFQTKLCATNRSETRKVTADIVDTSDMLVLEKRISASCSRLGTQSTHYCHRAQSTDNRQHDIPHSCRLLLYKYGARFPCHPSRFIILSKVVQIRFVRMKCYFLLCLLGLLRHAHSRARFCIP